MQERRVDSTVLSTLAGPRASFYPAFGMPTARTGAATTAAAKGRAAVALLSGTMESPGRAGAWSWQTPAAMSPPLNQQAARGAYMTELSAPRGSPNATAATGSHREWFA